MSTYPTQADVQSTTSPPQWLDDNFFRHDPFRFRSSQISFHRIVNSIAREFDVDRNGVFCIGSSAVGLSLNPTKIQSGRLKAVETDSDLDLALISAHYFELAWRDLLRASQPHLEQRTREFDDALSHQRKRLFDGAILANKLMSHLSFGSRWLASVDRVSEEIAVALGVNVDVEVWVYRDYWSLRNYVSAGLVKCQQRLRSGG